MVKEIGGYFQMELPRGKEYHNNAISLNSGRNCLLYILKAYNIQKIYYPYFSCESMLRVIKKYLPNVKIRFYHIDATFKPIINYPLETGFWLLYINYYGICSELMSSFGQRTIIDNSQSFFTNPILNQPTFYSPRKFFGVPDGGYLYSTKKIPEELDRDVSYQRTSHLLKRIDLSSSQGYKDFLAAETLIDEQPILRMSRLTQRLLSAIDYDAVIMIRRNNFFHLHNSLSDLNELLGHLSKFQNLNNFVPFVYPLKIVNGNLLRQRLIDHNIFIPKYWPPELLTTNKLSSIEYEFVENVVSLPIDQRYNLEDMERVLNLINGKD
ncbi:MAG: hypothetical protein ACTSPV_08035 [Candidatus Hodarchaeales archaeon]